MRYTLLVSLLMILILTTSSKSDSITTGNLLPNVGDGVDWRRTQQETVHDRCVLSDEAQ